MSSSLRRWLKRNLRPLAGELFYERRFGVDTGGTPEVTEADVEVDSHGYEPVPWRLLQKWLPPGDTDAEDVLLDVGCGKGRIVFQAARLYPFRQVIGLDFSPALLAVTRHNVERNRRRFRCRDIRLVEANAATWEIPDDVTVVTLYNPFWGKTFSAFLENLLASVDRRPRTVRMLYVHPTEEAVIQATGRFELLAASREMREPPSREFAGGSGRGIRLYSVLPLARVP